MDPGFLLVCEDTKITEVAFRELLVCRRWTPRNHSPTEDECTVWRHRQSFLGSGRAGVVSFSQGIWWLLGRVLWELYASPGKGLAQAKGQEPKGVWLVENGHTSSSLGCRAWRREVIAEARSALGSILQRARLSHSEILIGNAAPLRAFKEKDTIGFIPGWELLFPGLFGPEQMERVYRLDSPRETDHWEGMSGSVLALCLSNTPG